jgi:tetratricopeptide (TPR) repeat protein
LESKRIIELIKYPSSATIEEQEEIISLGRKYAYSDTLKIIMAKIASVNQMAEKNQFITTAALATADRANLKSYIQAGEWEISTPVQEPKTDEKTAQEEPSIEPEPIQNEELRQNITAPNLEPEEFEKPGEESTEIESGTAEVSTGEEVTPEIPGDLYAEEEITWLEENDEPEKKEYPQPSEDDGSVEKADVKPQANPNISSGEEVGSEIIRSDEDHQKSDEILGSASGKQKMDQEPRDPAEKEKPIPKLAEKNFEAIPEEQMKMNDPLSADLLKNIKEYRKSREFFEKLLQDNDQDKSEKTSGYAGKKDGKKGKKKSGKTDGKIPKVPEVKKNPEHSSQKIKALDQGTPSAGKGIREKDSVEAGLEKSAEKEAGKEKSESSSQKKIPVETPDKDILEKETEERKSEGYQVYEEEDPEVIKKFLERVAEASGEPEIPKKLKKEEQVELIENFIRTDPRIKNFKSPKGLKEREDLSLPSVKFNDDIISENLANILKSQGKTEQAIDIYKKLIWKYPQKKAYFASQIEELKKKSGK